MTALVSWSGGKDSCLAAYTAGIEMCGLVNTISEYERVRFHGVRKELIQAQAASLGLPLIQRETRGERYREDYIKAVSAARQADTHALVLGDIHLEPCLTWAQGVCAELALDLAEPLWGREPEEILREFIDTGFEAVVVSTQANLLGEKWIGRTLDHAFLEDILKTGCDPCGENGEYHTLVLDGPLFSRRIELLETRKVLRDGYWFLDIRGLR